jgi:ribonuclease Y
MINEILLVGGGLVIGGATSLIVSKKIFKINSNLYVEQARAKAKAIEHEATILLNDSKIKAKELEISLKDRYEDEIKKSDVKYSKRVAEVEKKDRELNSLFKDELKNITREKDELKAFQTKLKVFEKELITLENEYKNKMIEADRLIEHSSGMTKDEAKSIVLERVKDSMRAEIANIVRKAEAEAKKNAKKNANYILAQATTRYSGEYAAERLINTVNIPSDDLKGRIIGKEGRNIKSLEMILGVDIIIDDTPNVIILSSFNLYRRAVATKVIDELIKDGRIQPARIEDMYSKVTKEFEETILQEGEDIIFDMGITNMHPEIVKLIGKLKFRASYGQNALAHSLEVAHLSGIIAAECGGDEILARRAGILHDIGKALTHDFSGSHVDLGAEVCKRYSEDDVVINAIFAHHGHEEANSIESAAVCAADTLSAARPGARREVLEAFLKRVEDIESIATSKKGVRQAYAINAGREVRVILNAKLINESEATLLSREIAKDIEEQVQYPGEIKVNVIRETRAVELAK